MMQDEIICHALSAEALLSILNDTGLLLNKGKEQFIHGKFNRNTLYYTWDVVNMDSRQPEKSQAFSTSVKPDSCVWV